MKKLLIMLFCIIATLTLAACEKQSCSHRDADDNSLCDNCDESYTDGKDIEAAPCQHRDADDNTLCDNCGESYSDGKDIENAPCQHCDSDNNSRCDKCGESYSDDIDSAEHTHEYNQQNTDIKYLVTVADCKNAAIYYHSCSCGEIGETTFTYGDTTGHNHNIKNTNATYLATAADCKHAATYYYSCVCGNKGVTTFTSGTKTEHIPKEAVKENIVESTCTTDGKYDSVLYCKTCPLELSREVKIIPKEHKFVNDECKFCGNLKSSEGLSFSLNSDGKSYTVTWIGSFSGTDLIVDTYNNLPVTKISKHAFVSCDNLTSVTLGKSVTSIDEEAFYYCQNLKRITISNSVTAIANYAFKECPNLILCCETNNKPMGWNYDWNSSDWTSSVSFYPVIWGCLNYGTTNDGFEWVNTVNGIVVFNYTGIDAEVVLPKKINGNSIKGVVSAFRNCTILTKITISNGIENIGDNAFYGCNNLESVIIPDSVTSVGTNVFYNCPITYASIPSVVIDGIPKSTLKNLIITSGQQIASGALKNCTSLESLSIPFVGASAGDDGKNSHFGYIFGRTSTSSNSGSGGSYHYYYQGNYGMVYESYHIPSTLKTVIIMGEEIIGDKVFYGCTELARIEISTGIKTIGENAFRKCENLKDLVIPDSVTSIGLNAFYGCPIKNAKIPSCAISSINTASNYLESVIITSGDSIGQYSFYNCPKLKSVTISSSVKSIGAYAFAYCKNLTSVVFENPNGWWYSSNSSAANGTDITSTILSNASTAAEYIKTTYSEYYWKRS